MNIIALMPATEAYEVLLRNWGGDDKAYCCVWEEDAQHKFITFIPPNIPNKPSYYYCSGCATFNGMERFRADLRNGILTYQTLDNTTTYWVNFGTDYAWSVLGGYNKDTCFHVYGTEHKAELNEAPYEECEKIRDS
ncbi:16990_t:CDS:2 [Funneliformis caledonium]|uniref:16990_t:CDS:1 n=1 Tax=Funneliformis caledonium TaxID=1117310 RepID=A0A9N9IM57_9GLOM|nr:16990_t:CDS:2 [Funneliformis caledonium]